ncbi:tripartite tricarboxylate transporter TctB family protein [Inquilinus sp. CAU 1745]|uniref:tripartite tricarboxylate transporter TctB family protein n=1 Tax=Inquilinus sp. CAU 1745 TaxID=3140369 RepID=UPI00325AE740
MSDRIAGLLFLALSIWYGVTAGTYEASFGDPLGPAAFPVMLAIPAGLFSLYLILRPDPDPEWSVGGPLLRQVATLAVLVGYALLLEDLGYLAATFAGVVLMSRLLGAGWLKSAISGAAMSIGLYIVFDRLLGLPLPLLPEFMS